MVQRPLSPFETGSHGAEAGLEHLMCLRMVLDVYLPASTFWGVGLQMQYT